MNIKNEEAYKLTKQLAELTGESLRRPLPRQFASARRVRIEHGDDLAERLL